VLGLENARRKRRAEALQQRADLLTARARGASLTHEEREELKRDYSDFKLEVSKLQEQRSDPHTLGTFVTAARVAQALQRTGHRRQQKNQAFGRLILRIESETYFCDLALWFLLPVYFSVELTGDLQEELAQRSAKQGRDQALSWYRRQVRATIATVINQRLALGHFILRVLRSLWDLFSRIGRCLEMERSSREMTRS
jgi:hypothetical protein